MNSFIYIAVLLSAIILVSTRPPKQTKPENEVGGPVEQTPFEKMLAESDKKRNEKKKKNNYYYNYKEMDEDVDEMDKEENKMAESANDMDQDEKLNRQNEGIQGPNWAGDPYVG